MNKKILIAFGLCLLYAAMAVAPANAAPASKKTVYLTYILHGNMNYDRYVRPTIWKEFPYIYDNLLDFMDEHRDFKGQVQFSGQTLSSLRQCAPQVLEHAMAIHKRGQLNFTGTFYSEPVNVNMDGETNYRCAWLGTKIVEDYIGEKTDGFYLQERAYHSQLPWILSHSDVSWVPVITGEEDWYPFRLLGTDGSKTVCVPVTRHGEELLARLEKAPSNSLLLIEEDYEIPQSFVETYEDVRKFVAAHPGVQVKWITVKEYISRFGLRGERMVGHGAKARSLVDGTYSRWTADPLDIMVQNVTNKAMEDYRAARIFNAILRKTGIASCDVPVGESLRPIDPDPLAWNIERADLYPDIETRFLQRDGRVTLLSRAENLLLWAVNSDAKGWFPLYEKRRERMSSLSASSALSREVIDRGMDSLASGLRLEGYQDYYLAVNMEGLRKELVNIGSDSPLEVFDYALGTKLPSSTKWTGEEYVTEVAVNLPSYGYCVLATKNRKAECGCRWKDGDSISADGISVSAKGDSVEINDHGRVSVISLEDFDIKFLGQLCGNDIEGVGQWRRSEPYGSVRTSVCEGLYPQLRIDRQPDWLLHLRQTVSIIDGRVVLDMDFDFPHPTLVINHESALPGKRSFDPRGLNLRISTRGRGVPAYDMPYGIASLNFEGLSHLCPLSSCLFQQDGHGVMVSPRTGEQAMSVNADNGDITVYMGASTTSGPAKDLGIEYPEKTATLHKTAWYSEPFHGKYHHRIILKSWEGQWNEAHMASVIRELASPVYLRRCIGGGKGEIPARGSWIDVEGRSAHITMADCCSEASFLRINEHDGREAELSLGVCGKQIKVKTPAFGIVNVDW